MTDFDKARALINEFKGDSYLFGPGILPGVGEIAANYGKSAAIVRGTFINSDDYVNKIRGYLTEAGISVATEIKGSRPNSPAQDVKRISEKLDSTSADVLISFGGGSTIDAVKAAIVLCCEGGNISEYFGINLVTEKLKDSTITLKPHIAIQTLAGSAAHLTKYANVTDLATSQKKLIVDNAVVPDSAVFDYSVTYSTPNDLTIDGAMDGISHMLEVLYGAIGKSHYKKVQEILSAGLVLVLECLPKVLEDPNDHDGREGLCLATDLGGYAIMTGGTNGGHLTSFSLVDILAHGRACGIMNPYYSVFFAPAIEEPLRLVGSIFKRAGFSNADFENLSSEHLGRAVAQAMFAFAGRIGFPTRLKDVEGFSRAHITRALKAAKNPQLKMKLQNMPVPLSSETVDEYMGSVLEAAVEGDLSLIKTMPI